MKIQCPSVGSVVELTHEPCTSKACVDWWDPAKNRCSAADTIPVGNVTKRKKCALADRCRWSLQDPARLCPPMRLGMLCQHQGGQFNTFDFEEL